MVWKLIDEKLFSQRSPNGVIYKLECTWVSNSLRVQNIYWVIYFAFKSCFFTIYLKFLFDKKKKKNLRYSQYTVSIYFLTAHVFIVASKLSEISSYDIVLGLYINTFSQYIVKQFLDFCFDPKTTLFARSFRRRVFAYHYAVNHPHTNIILSWFSIPLVLKCAAKSLKIGLQIKI